MIMELPPTKHAADFTREERIAAIVEAQAAAAAIVERLRRLAELEQVLEGRAGRGDGDTPPTS